MATLKLRKPAAAAGTPPAPKRAPVRGHANRARPTLKEAQAQRTERERDEAVPATRGASDTDKRQVAPVRREPHERRDTHQRRDAPERQDTRQRSGRPERD